MSARRVTTGALLVAMTVPVLAGPALAVDDPVTGYWKKTTFGPPVSLSAPDPAPEGGMWVSNDPTGPAAVSAVRAGADPGNVVVGLRLTIADAVGPTAVLVCPTLDRWAPEQGGRLEVAPEADCSSPVETGVEEGVLVVDLPSDLQGVVVDLLLSPDPSSSFSVTFEPATADSVVQAPEEGALEDVGSLPTTTSEEDFTPASGEAGGFSGGTDFGVPDFGAPATASEPLLPAPALPEPATALVPQPQAAPPPAPGALAGPQPAVPVDRTASLLAVALLVGLAALALRLAVQPVEAPRHLGGGARLTRPDRPAAEGAPGASATSPVRGVGRFRSTRVGPPVRI